MSIAGKLKDLSFNKAAYCEVTGKVKFDKKGAQTSANARWAWDRVELRIYPCPHCNGWHLTSQIRRKKNSESEE